MEENEQAKKEKTNVSSEEVDNTDYIAAIKELKEKSVDRSKYDQLKAENKRLLNSIVTGQGLENEQERKQSRDVKVIRNELFNHDHNNLEYITLALELRDALIESGQPDPFLPIGKQISPDMNDIECANRCAKVYKECMEYANGDSELFTQELQRRTNKSMYDSVIGQRKY